MTYPLDEDDPFHQYKEEEGSLPTSTGFPAQNPETKKNSIFHFLSDEGRDLTNLH